MRRLNVLLALDPAAPIKVGELFEQQRNIYFQYDPAWLSDGFSLSPYHLRCSPELIQDEVGLWQGLHGVFNDSLPDGWGLLLMDRELRKSGVDPHRVSPLHRLAWLGHSTMGALVYEPVSGPDSDSLLVDLNRLANNAQQVFSGQSDEVLPELFRAGGSPGGARPKALIATKGDQVITADGEIPQGFVSWLVKFSAKDDFPDAGNIEYAYSLMAKDAGIDMPNTQLMEGQYFATQRFDRTAAGRHHIHTFGNMVGADFRVPNLDYEDLFRVVLDVTKSRQELLKSFRQMIFNIATHNRDDHSKNFAFFWSQPERGWRLTPAYDLMFSNGIHGEHTMTVAGEGRQPAKSHIMQLAKQFSVETEAKQYLDQVGAVVQNWKQYAEQAEVSVASRGLFERFPVL